MATREELREVTAKWLYMVNCDAPEEAWYSHYDHVKENWRKEADKLLHVQASQGAVIQVKCPDCAWIQFKDGESVGMTPCFRCNSTGYILEPLIEEE